MTPTLSLVLHLGTTSNIFYGRNTTSEIFRDRDLLDVDELEPMLDGAY